MKMQNEFINTIFPKGFDIKKYQNKRIIIVGGGPSTRDVNWERVEYDYIFSCNYFYECDKLKNKHVEIASIINRIFDKPLNSNLIRYLDNNTFPAIEPYHTNKVYEWDSFQNFYNDYQNNCIFFDTQLQNKSGAGPRIALLAASLQPKTIYTVGIDGYVRPNIQHSFIESAIGVQDGNKITDVNTHHIEFVKYFHTLTKNLNIEYYNLAEDYIDNIASQYTKIYCPLPEEIKKILND